MDSRNGASIQVAVATALGIVSGLGSAWLIYFLHPPNGSNYWGLAPTPISLLVYGAVAALRLSKAKAPTGILVATAIAGAVVLVTFGSLLIIMIGCRYDACINL
jgi:hypothetical protein